MQIRRNFSASLSGVVTATHVPRLGQDVCYRDESLTPPARKEVYSESELDLYMQCPARYRYESSTACAADAMNPPISAFIAASTHHRLAREERARGQVRRCRRGASGALAKCGRTNGPVGHAFEKYYRSTAEGMVARMAEAIAAETGDL